MNTESDPDVRYRLDIYGPEYSLELITGLDPNEIKSFINALRAAGYRVDVERIVTVTTTVHI